MDQDGAISLLEFTDYLKGNAIKANSFTIRLLFEQFDKDKDGKISFKEFHRPNKNETYNYYGVQA